MKHENGSRTHAAHRIPFVWFATRVLLTIFTPRTTGTGRGPTTLRLVYRSGGFISFCLVATRFTIPLLGPSVRRHIGHRTPITPERETRADESPSFRCALNLRPASKVKHSKQCHTWFQTAGGP